MKRDVVVIPFPFSVLSGSKRRPALEIADWNGADVMLCQITSRSKKDGIEVSLGADDFIRGGLPAESHIRPNKIFTAERPLILYTAERLRTEKYEQVVQGAIELIQ